MFMSAFENHTYAALRIVTGLLFTCHGTQKVLGFPASSFEFPPLAAYVSGPIELIAGVLIMVGFMTHWAAFLSSGLMAAAYWLAHGLKAPLPLQNGGELAALYCFVFLFLAAKGSGIWSVDAARGNG